MYAQAPSRAYVFEEVWADAAATVRAERVLAALGAPPTDTIGVGDLPDVIRDNGLVNTPARGNNLPLGESPVYVLNVLRVDEPDRDALCQRLVAQCPENTSPNLVQRLLGLNWTACGGPIRSGELACRRTNEFHTIHGCLHRCAYCPLAANQSVALAMNLEQFVATELDRVVRENPWQLVFRYQSQVSDALCFEPEYGASEVFGNYFARRPGRFLLLHTSSANTDHLLELGHQDSTIVTWSVTSRTVSREIEPGAGAMEERIEAARRCQQAGYTIRFKLKPIIPIKGWRDECRELVEQIFARTRPDNISLCVLMWMTAEDFLSVFDPDDFDPAYMQAMAEQADNLRDHLSGPFPDNVRAEIYSFLVDEVRKHDRDVPVALSTETRTVWDQLGPKLGFTPQNFVCGCGPRCTPGLRVLDPPETFVLE